MSKSQAERATYIRSMQHLHNMGITKGIGGSKTRGQLLDADRYMGVPVTFDSEGNWHAVPGSQHARASVVLVVRRVDQRTAVIVDSKGNVYSEPMRIADATRLLRELEA